MKKGSVKTAWGGLTERRVEGIVGRVIPGGVGPVTKVLVVEDNEDSREILLRQLKHLGYEVMEAGSGREALRQVARGKPDIVVLDIMMPGEDGRDVARKIRQDPKTKDIPILAATVLFQREDIQSCLDAGCNDVLTKPFQLPELKERLAKLLSPSKKPL